MKCGCGGGWGLQITLQTSRMRYPEGDGKSVLCKKLSGASASACGCVGGGAGGGGGGVGSAGPAGPAGPAGSVVPDTVTATSAQREWTFPEVLKMAEAVVAHFSALPQGGILGSAFKAAFRNLHGCELQLKFGGQRVQLKDIMEQSRVVERVIDNTQPKYR